MSMETIGAVARSRVVNRRFRIMEHYRKFRLVWRCGQRTSWMCGLCHLVRYHADFCDTCLAHLPWNTEELVYTFKAFGEWFQIREQTATMIEAEAEPLEA